MKPQYPKYINLNVLTRMQELCGPDTDLFGQFHFFKDIDVDQTVASVLKTDGQVHSHHIDPLSYIVPYGVPVRE